DEGLCRAIAEKRRTLADGSEMPQRHTWRDGDRQRSRNRSGHERQGGEGQCDDLHLRRSGNHVQRYLLSQSAEWRERVLAEASRLDDITWHEAVEVLADTRAVVEEALRLYPLLSQSHAQRCGAPKSAGARSNAAPSSSYHRT